MATINDLKVYARIQSRRSWSDYAGDIQAWNSSTYRIRRQREQCRKFARWIIGTEQLVPGSYGRLTISESGNIDTVWGQYPPEEIYNYVLEYLEQTN